MGRTVFVRLFVVLLSTALASEDSCPAEGCAVDEVDDKKYKEISFENGKEFGFAVDVDEPEMHTVHAIKNKSQAENKGVLIGMKVVKINGEKMQGIRLVAALTRASESATGGSVTITFDTQFVTMQLVTAADKVMYARCIADMERIELEAPGKFDDIFIKTETATLESIREQIIKSSTILKPRTADAEKTAKYEAFKHVINETLFLQPVDYNEDDFFFGAHDVCQYMFACRESCPITPKQLLERKMAELRVEMELIYKLTDRR